MTGRVGQFGNEVELAERARDFGRDESCGSELPTSVPPKLKREAACEREEATDDRSQ
jgi:hypothetical protein